MHPCPSCACLVRRGDLVCPHCTSPMVRRPAPTWVAIGMLGLATCVGGTTKSDTGSSTDDTDDTVTTTSTWTPQPPYGVPPTDTWDTGTPTTTDTTTTTRDTATTPTTPTDTGAACDSGLYSNPAPGCNLACPDGQYCASCLAPPSDSGVYGVEYACIPCGAAC